MSAWVFTRRADGYSARIHRAEREVLADVVDQVVELLGGDPHRADDEHPLDGVRLGVGPIPVPTDPAVHRLLPDGSRDDAELAAEFRRLTESDLRSTKVGNLLRLRRVLVSGLSVGGVPVEGLSVEGLPVEGSGDRVVVPAAEAPAVAAAMTDLRLVVAERLGVHTEEDADEVYRWAAATAPDGGEPDLDPDSDLAHRLVARRLLAVLSVMLGVLQDSLVELMLEEMPPDPPPGAPLGSHA